MMNTSIRCLLLILVAVFCVSCAPIKGKTNPVGVWYSYSNSNYLEIIIWPEQIHSTKGKGGNNLWVSDWLFYYSPDDLLEGSLGSCEVKNDTLFLFGGGLQTDTAIMHNGQIVLAIDTIELRFTRVSADDVMSQILMIDTLSWDDINFRNYLEGYNQRKYAVKLNDVSR